MKKAIVVCSNTMLVNRIEDNNRIMREVMAKECGFDILVMDVIDTEKLKGYDLVFIDPYKYLNCATAESTMKMFNVPILKRRNALNTRSRTQN